MQVGYSSIIYIHTSSVDEDLELSGAPHPYTYNTRKKIPRNLKKNLGFWDIKRGFSMYFGLKFGEKITGNVFAAKKDKNFLCIAKHCLGTFFSGSNSFATDTFFGIFSRNFTRK